MTIDVTLGGMVTPVMPVAPPNAQRPMVVTVLGTVYVPGRPPGYATSVVPLLSKSTPPVLVNVVLNGSTLMAVMLGAKASPAHPMEVTLAGIVTSPLHDCAFVTALLPSMVMEPLLLHATYVSPIASDGAPTRASAHMVPATAIARRWGRVWAGVLFMEPPLMRGIGGTSF
jgi:hypothetical protein